MISIVMPAHNEEGYLEPAAKSVVAGLRERALTFEVIVVENGSVDGTAAEANLLSSTYPEVSVVHAAVADYGQALRAGFLEAHGEIVVNFDVDFVDLDFLDRALAELQTSGAAVVVGSKVAAGAVDQRGLARRAVTGVFSTVLTVGFGLRVGDTHGVKALRRDRLVAIVDECTFGRDIFDTELVIRAERAGLGVAEIPVNVREQRPARTPVARRIPGALAGLAQLRVKLWRERSRRAG